MQTRDLLFFINESNMIEGLYPHPNDQLEIYEKFLSIDIVNIVDLQEFVSQIQPGAILRDRWGLDVRVGNHIPPYGGPEIAHQLHYILNMVSEDQWTPYRTHTEYETLHPFMDGNGRSGRALWLWQTENFHLASGPINGSFLHMWYYQSLDEAR